MFISLHTAALTALTILFSGGIATAATNPQAAHAGGTIVLAPSIPETAAAQPAGDMRLAQISSAQAQPAGQRAYAVGQRVEYVEDGKWFAAIITKVASQEETATFGPYHVYRVHALGYVDDKWVSAFTDTRAQIRPAGSGPTEPVPGGEAADPVLKAMSGAADAAPAQAQASAAGTIPSGHYGCDFAGGGSAGYVDIRGSSYRGPSSGVSGDFRPYAMSAGNSITWTVGFGQFSVVGSQYMGADSGGRPAFSVTYARTRGGGVDRIDCLRE